MKTTPAAPTQKAVVTDEAARHGLSKAASVNLDMIRGAAAILVMVEHWRYLLFVDANQNPRHGIFQSLFYFVSGLGHQAVLVFFVLSGYLVGGSAIRSIRRGSWSWKKYLIDRSVRLYIVVVPALLATTVLDHIGIDRLHAVIYQGSGQYAAMMPDPVQSHLGIGTLLGNLVYLQGILTSTFGSNGPMWSLANEFWYYIAFPFILLASLSKRSVPVRIGSACAAILVIVLVGKQIDLQFPIWIAGAALAGIKAPNWLGTRAAAYGFFVIWLVFLAISRAHALHNLMLETYLLGAATTVWIWSIICSQRERQPDSYRKIATTLSHLSYSNYLFHTPFIVLIAALLGSHRWDSSPNHLLEAFGILGLTCGYTALAWLLFESRTLRVRDRAYRWLNISR